MLEVPVEQGSFNVELTNTDLADAIGVLGTTDVEKFEFQPKNVEIEESVANIIKPFYGAFKSIPTPEELSIEFGVKIAVKSGKITALLVEGGGEVQVAVKATWKRQ